MTSHLIHSTSKSAIKVKVCEDVANFLSKKEGIQYSVNVLDIAGGTDESGSIVEQPFNSKTYAVSKSRVITISKNDKLAENSIVFAFENGIMVSDDRENVMDFCVMTIQINGVITQYTSFGIQIDKNLFDEYIKQNAVDLKTEKSNVTFGSFLAAKVTGVTSNDWMSDIRFGGIKRQTQLESCVHQFYLDRYARYIPNYPRDGIIFKDITPIMSDPTLLSIVFADLKRIVEDNFGDVDYFAGLDARGFYFAPTLAQIFNKGFIPVRKAGKLPVSKDDRKDPTKVIIEAYSTEYSDDEFGLIPDPLYVGKKVLILDDLLATGGSILGASRVLNNAQMKVVGALTVYDVKSLRGTTNALTNEFKIMTLDRPDYQITECNEQSSCIAFDMKKVAFPMTDIMIQRLHDPPHFDVSQIENTIYDSTMSDDSNSNSNSNPSAKLSRRYTLSSYDWNLGKRFSNKLDNVRVLFTERDASFAKEIMKSLVTDQDDDILKTYFERFGVMVKAGKFPNGESHAFIKSNIRNCHVFIVSRIRTGHINDDLMELYLIMDACNRSGVDKKTVIMPYYPYSRSDKKDAPRTHIGAAVQASFLTDLNVDNLVSLDLHAGQIQGLVPRGFHNLYLQNYLAEYILANYLRYYPESSWNEKIVLVAPDAGSTKAIKAYSNIFKIDNIALDKTRSYKAAENGQSVVHKVRFIGDKEDFAGKIGLIIDDIGDTMGTMSAAIDTLVENGLSYAIVFVTHGVLSGPAMERINSNHHIKEIVVSDSLPQEFNKTLSPKLRVVSTAELFGRTIDGILTGRSISRLLEYQT